MVEERNVGTARAPETTANDDEATKAELQRRMEETRESITQTVSEIKDTVANQYQNVRDSIHGALDWREHYRKSPVAFSLGALTVGLFVGYGLGSMIADDERADVQQSVWDIENGDDLEDGDSQTSFRSYAAGAITGGPSTAGDRYEPPHAAPQVSSAVGFAGSSHESTEPKGPGLLERFKGTQAFDRLQAEMATIGDRLIDEVSHTAQAVVLPALLGKVKDLIGIDLSTQQQIAKRAELEHQTANEHSQSKAASSSEESGNM